MSVDELAKFLILDSKGKSLHTETVIQHRNIVNLGSFSIPSRLHLVICICKLGANKFELAQFTFSFREHSSAPVFSLLTTLLQWLLDKSNSQGFFFACLLVFIFKNVFYGLWQNNLGRFQLILD